MQGPDSETAKLVFLTEQQVASVLCVSVRTLQKWRLTGQGPAFHKFGQAVRYSSADLHIWIVKTRQNLHQPSSPSQAKGRASGPHTASARGPWPATGAKRPDGGSL